MRLGCPGSRPWSAATTTGFVTLLSTISLLMCVVVLQGYLAEPQNQEEQDKIVEFITQGEMEERKIYSTNCRENSSLFLSC